MSDDITDIRSLLIEGFMNDGVEVGCKMPADAIERVRESAMRTLGQLSLEGYIIPEPEVDVDENGVVTFSCSFPPALRFRRVGDQ